jgi:hypothetical protein
MNVEIRTVATQVPEKEYINGIFLAVHVPSHSTHDHFLYLIGPAAFLL